MDNAPRLHQRRPRERSGPPTAAFVLAAAAGLSTYAVVTLLNRQVGRTPDSAPARTRRGLRRFGGYTVTGRTVLINRPREELYRFWRELSNLPSFMENLESVEETDGQQIWKIRAPLGRSVEIVTEIVEERSNEHLSWASLPGSDIETKGRITFRDAPAGRGTYVEAIIAYQPPAGEIGRLVAKLFAAEPRVQSRRDLKRFKMLMETGEIATNAMRRIDQ